MPQWVGLAKDPAGPIFTPSGAEWDEEWFVMDDALRVGEGYVMYYEGRPKGRPTRQIGLATSADGLSWHPHVANPVLRVGPAGSWDDNFVTDAEVLVVGDEYWMFYVGHDGTTERIGLAFSADGVVWRKHEGNPILTESAEGWDRHHVIQPTVVRLRPDRWLMWFGSYGGEIENHQVGLATSTDGLHWHKHLGNPVFGLGAAGEWDCGAAFGPDVTQIGDTFHMLYAGGPRPGVYDIGHAFSTDGVTWHRSPQNPVVRRGPEGAFDCLRLGVPCLLSLGGDAYRVYYSGHNGKTYVGVACATGALRDR